MLNIHRKIWTWMVISALFVRVKKVERSQMFVNWSMNKYNAAYPYNRLCFADKKEWSTNAYYKMNELWKHYTKWKKARNKRLHILWLHLCEISRTGQFLKLGTLGENEEWLLIGMVISFCSEKNILELRWW